SGARADLQRAAQRRHAIGEVVEARPAAAVEGIEADAGVLAGEAQTAAVLAELHDGGRAAAGVLGRVLQALDAAEVDRRLELLGVPADVGSVDADRDGRIGGGGPSAG